MTQLQVAPPVTAAPAGLVVRVLRALLVFQGVSALGGGITMLADTSGELLHADPAWLEAAPVDSFLLPGLILALPLGAVPLYLAWALGRRPRYAWTAPLERATGHHAAWAGVLALGVGLVTFILVEGAIIGWHWLQGVYGGVGLALVGLAALPSARRDLATR